MRRVQVVTPDLIELDREVIGLSNEAFVW